MEICIASTNNQPSNLSFGLHRHHSGNFWSENTEKPPAEPVRCLRVWSRWTLRLAWRLS